jgi:hypothetical protein
MVDGGVRDYQSMKIGGFPSSGLLDFLYRAGCLGWELCGTLPGRQGAKAGGSMLIFKRATRNPVPFLAQVDDRRSADYA